MGKTGDLFKKTLQEIFKGIFHLKMCIIKDRNGKDLIEAEEIKESKNTQRNCTKKILMTLITTVVWSFT